MGIHEKIDEILNERGLSRRKLASMAGIAPTTLQSALSRKQAISFEMLDRIADALNIPVSELLSDEQLKRFKMDASNRGLRSILESFYDKVVLEWSYTENSDGEREYDGFFFVTLSKKGKEDIVLDAKAWNTLYQAVGQNVLSYVNLIWEYEAEKYGYGEPDNYRGE